MKVAVERAKSRFAVRPTWWTYAARGGTNRAAMRPILNCANRFSTWLELRALDRIGLNKNFKGLEVEVSCTLRARVASDHLPLVAHLHLDDKTGTEVEHVHKKTDAFPSFRNRD